MKQIMRFIVIHFPWAAGQRATPADKPVSRPVPMPAQEAAGYSTSPISAHGATVHDDVRLLRELDCANAAGAPLA